MWWPGAPSPGPHRWSPGGPELCCGAAARSEPLQGGDRKAQPVIYGDNTGMILTAHRFMFEFHWTPISLMKLMNAKTTHRPYSCPPAGTFSADMPGTGYDEPCPLDTCLYRPGTC